MGWIKLHYRMREHWLWEDKPFSEGQAWLDLLLMTNWKDSEELYEGRVVTHNRCEIACSIVWLSQQWGWSRQKTRWFINKLVDDGMISVSSTTAGTIIRVLNYEKWQQPTEQPTQQPTEQPTGSVEKPTAVGTQQPTKQPTEQPTQQPHNKTNKKYIYKYIYKGRHEIPPSIEDVKAYCEERGNDVDPERFVNFYESKGWMVGKNKMKDWQACVRTWEKKERSSNGKQHNAKNQNTDQAKGKSDSDYGWLYTDG